MHKTLLLICLFALAATPTWAAQPPKPCTVLLIDGQNNHDWKATTPLLRQALERTGLFKVTLATTPPAGADQSAWKTFQPAFEQYDLVLSNFTDFGAKPCPTDWLDALAKFVRQGGGLVIVHAATSGMYHHPEYARMAGMGWANNAKVGDRLHLDDAGQTIRTPKGQGPATAHGKPFAWTVRMWAPQHPICADLPQEWLHATDELWAAPRGPAQDVQILATALAPETKQNEPVLWTVRYGQGRVFVTLLGHDTRAMRCTGFQTTLARGAQWAATGQVTLPLPKNFPTKDRPSIPAE